MPEPEPARRPLGDEFWLTRGRDMVEEATGRRDDAARSLARTSGLAWTLYVVACVVAIGLGDLGLFGVVALVVPVLALGATYLAALWAMNPATVDFDPRSPTQVELAFWRAVSVKKRRVLWTTVLSGVSTVLVVAALLVAASPVGHL